MKIKPEHVAHLKREIEMCAEANGGIASIADDYERGVFPRSEGCKDLQKRFCFDGLFAAPGLTAWVCQNIYPYANDDHLFTALKSFMPAVERKY